MTHKVESLGCGLLITVIIVWFANLISGTCPTDATRQFPTVLGEWRAWDYSPCTKIHSAWQQRSSYRGWLWSRLVLFFCCWWHYDLNPDTILVLDDEFDIVTVFQQLLKTVCPGVRAYDRIIIRECHQYWNLGRQDSWFQTLYHIRYLNQRLKLYISDIRSPSLEKIGPKTPIERILLLPTTCFAFLLLAFAISCFDLSSIHI